MFLLKINKAENNLCTFCKGTPETILVQTFWNAFVELINNNCPHIYNLSLVAELIIFGENNINRWYFRSLYFTCEVLHL